MSLIIVGRQHFSSSRKSFKTALSPFIALRRSIVQGHPSDYYRRRCVAISRSHQYCFEARRYVAVQSWKEKWLKCYPRRYHLPSFEAFPLTFRWHSRGSRWRGSSEAAYVLCPIDRTNIRRLFRNPSAHPNFFHLFLPSPPQTRATTTFAEQKNFHLFLPDAVRPHQIRRESPSHGRRSYRHRRRVTDTAAAMGTPINTADAMHPKVKYCTPQEDRTGEERERKRREEIIPCPCVTAHECFGNSTTSGFVRGRYTD